MGAAETTIEKSHKLPTFDDITSGLLPAQVLVLEMVAGWAPPSEIIEKCKASIDRGETNERWIRCVSSTAQRPAKFGRVVEWIRGKAASEQPILDPGWRYKQRARVVEKAIDTGDYSAALEALRDVDRHQGTVGADGPGAAVQVNVIGDAVLGDLTHRIGALSGGALPALPVVEGEVIADE